MEWCHCFQISSLNFAEVTYTFDRTATCTHILYPDILEHTSIWAHAQIYMLEKVLLCFCQALNDTRVYICSQCRISINAVALAEHSTCHIMDLKNNCDGKEGETHLEKGHMRWQTWLSAVNQIATSFNNFLVLVQTTKSLFSPLQRHGKHIMWTPTLLVIKRVSGNSGFALEIK